MDAHSLSSEHEGDAIRRLCRMVPRNTGSNPHAILWNTVARSSKLREGLEQTQFAKHFVVALRRASWFKGQRIAAFLGRYTNVTSSRSRSKGNARRKAKRSQATR